MVFRALVTAEAVGGKLLALSGVIADMTGWRHKRLLSNLRGKGRSVFMSSEMWHITNKDSLLRLSPSLHYVTLQSLCFPFIPLVHLSAGHPTLPLHATIH